MTDIRPPHDYDPLCKCDVCRYELHLRSLPGAAADDGDEVLTMREETDLSAKLKKANNLVARLTAQVERMRVQTAQMGRDWDADIELIARAQARERVVQSRVETASRDLRSICGLASNRRLRLHLLRALATLRGEVEEAALKPEPPTFPQALRVIADGVVFDPILYAAQVITNQPDTVRREGVFFNVLEQIARGGSRFRRGGVWYDTPALLAQSALPECQAYPLADVPDEKEDES